jgi:hypothetical protein
MRHAWVCITAIVLLSLTASLLAEHDDDAAGWVQLGTTRVDFKKDRDVIEVGRDEGKFTRLRLEARDGDLVVENVKVVFNSGETFSPEVRHVFKEGARTRVIDLPGGARVIRQVEFTARSQDKGDAATIVLYGRKAKGD